MGNIGNHKAGFTDFPDDLVIDFIIVMFFVNTKRFEARCVNSSENTLYCPPCRQGVD